jgi:hypothetical protein
MLRMSWCCTFGAHAISLCATKQEGNGRAIGKTFEKTTPGHLRDVSTRKSQWQNDKRPAVSPGFMSQPSGGESEALQLEKSNLAYRAELISCYGEALPVSGDGSDFRGRLLAIPIRPYPAAYGLFSYAAERHT